MSAPYDLDRRGVRRAFSRAAQTYDDAAVLQKAVREELLSRLDLVTLQPAVVLDLGCGTGHATRALLDRYAPARGALQALRAALPGGDAAPRARVIGIDLAPGMLAACAARFDGRRRFETLCADVRGLPLPDAAADLAFSSLMLQWVADLDTAFAEVRRVLRPGALFAFATFGPDTLHELRAAWRAVDAHTHVSEFTDMPDLAAGLLRAGFADPVLDVDRHRLTYSTALELMRDLKAIGAQNQATGRPRGLTGRGALARMTDAYESFRDADGRLPATYEVVYGHAWVPSGEPQRAKRGSRAEVSVPLSALRRGNG